MSVVSSGPSRSDSYLSPAEFPELVLGATVTGDLTRRGQTELGTSEMADEALAGLDEAALRKLVSSPITHIVRTGKPGQRGRAFQATSQLTGGGYGGGNRRKAQGNRARPVPHG